MSMYTNIEEIGKLIGDIFKTLPKPVLPPEYDIYGILNADGSSCRIWCSEGCYYDTYITWIGAKSLNTTPRKRKAVAIEWSSDELENNPEDVVRRKLQIATSQFNELAEEYPEGGIIPKAKGVLRIHPDEEPTITLDMTSASLSLSSLYWIVSAISEAESDIVTCEIKNTATDGMDNLKACLLSAINAKASESQIKPRGVPESLKKEMIETLSLKHGDYLKVTFVDEGLYLVNESKEYRDMGIKYHNEVLAHYKIILKTLLDTILDPHSTSSNTMSVARDLNNIYFKEPDPED